MFTAIIILILIICVLLVLVVLLQDSKGGILAGASGASQLIGTKRTTDILEKLTWGFMIGIMLLTFAAWFSLPTQSDLPSNLNIKAAQEKGAPAPAPAPATPAAGTQPAPTQNTAPAPAAPAPTQ